MQYLFPFFTALVISVFLVPLMIRVAPRLGLIDQPDPRKVHKTPIPRAGGIGIVLGGLIPVALWLPLDVEVQAYLWGGLVLLVFGLWDDIFELGHYAKFAGQFLAVIPVVYYADLHIHSLPFLEPDGVSDQILKPFTVFALVGMINALNHSDGLDGLAGGLSVLSFAAIAYLAHTANGQTAVMIAVAALGGIVGFLRYNSHPARVFMGDGGSQFLGFSLGFLAILLTQRVNSAISPALPALLLGLPIVDILAVFAQRISNGMNWFRATRNHIHHRLLDLGFGHYGSVTIIYSVQTVLVLSAVLMSYESDGLILALYAGVCATLFLFLYVAESREWHVAGARLTPRFSSIEAFKLHPIVINSVMLKILAATIAVLFLGASLTASEVPRDLAISSAALAVLLLYLVVARRDGFFTARIAIYVTAAFAIYLETRYVPGLNSGLLNIAATAYFGFLAVAIGFAMRFGASDFRTTPMDFLILFFVLSVGFLMQQELVPNVVGVMLIKLVIVFYACELVLSRLNARLNPLSMSALTTLGILGLRGLV